MDIDELLAETYSNVEFLKTQLALAKTDESVANLSKPKIKSTLEHLRSCLEYSAHEIAERVLKIRHGKIYFPYGVDEQEFVLSVKRNLPGLSGTYYELVESIQPHINGNDWLIKLCKFTNHNKHISLQKQERENKGKTTTRVGDFTEGTDSFLKITNSGTGKVIIGKIFDGDKLLNPDGPFVVSNQRSVESMKNDVQNLIKIEREFEEVIFREETTGIDFVGFLEKAYFGIVEFENKLRDELI